MAPTHIPYNLAKDIFEVAYIEMVGAFVVSVLK